MKRLMLILMGLLVTAGHAGRGIEDACCDPYCWSPVSNNCCVLLEHLQRFGNYLTGPLGSFYSDTDFGAEFYEPVIWTCLTTWRDCPGTESEMNRLCTDNYPPPQHSFVAFCGGFDCMDFECCEDALFCNSGIIAECTTLTLYDGDWRTFDSDHDRDVDLKDYAFLQNQFGQ